MCVIGMMTGCTVALSRIAIPVDTTFLQLGVGAKIMERNDEDSFIRVAPLWLGDDYIHCLNLSLISTSFANDGLAIGGILQAHEGRGISAALVDCNEDHTGIRLGLFVCGGRQDGLQIGLFNMCSDDSHVLQIGLLNWAGENEEPRFLLNGSWGIDEEEEFSEEGNEF
jgi:hypothetical protein